MLCEHKFTVKIILRVVWERVVIPEEGKDVSKLWSRKNMDKVCKCSVQACIQFGGMEQLLNQVKRFLNTVVIYRSGYT